MSSKTRLLLFLSTILLTLPSTSISHTIASSQETPPCEERPHSIKDLLCCFQGGKGPDHCLDHAIEQYAEEKNTPGLLQEIQHAMEVDPLIKSQCHPMVHAIGRYITHKEPDIGKALAACDPTCHWGCFHGAIERLFITDAERAAGITHPTPQQLQEHARSLCSTLDQSLPIASTQCFHGLGHALLFSLSYDLIAALEICDTLGTSYARNMCHTGIFMEHTLGLGREERIQPSDPLFPCSALPEKYKANCFGDQTRVMIILDLPDEEIAALCRTTGKYAPYCFRSFGRDMSSRFHKDTPTRTMRACEELSAQYSSNCIAGAVDALLDHWESAEEAMTFCTSLTQQNNVVLCFQKVISRLKNLYNKSVREVEAICERFALPHTSDCLEQVHRAFSLPLEQFFRSLFKYWRQFLSTS